MINNPSSSGRFKNDFLWLSEAIINGSTFVLGFKIEAFQDEDM